MITTPAMLAEHFNGNVPTALADVDFTTDRLILARSNPEIEFVVDTGVELVAGLEQLCQGIAPSCVGYVVHANTSDGATPFDCPYTGPDPCLAP